MTGIQLYPLQGKDGGDSVELIESGNTFRIHADERSQGECGLSGREKTLTIYPQKN